MVLSSLNDVRRDALLDAQLPSLERPMAAPLPLGCVMLLLSDGPAPASSAQPYGSTQFAGGLVFGLVLVLLLALFARARSKASEREIVRLKELAEHCEHERNVAQQELMLHLEEERELAKEKMQFESQLSDYEKYASLAQLALGAAHEINNPLMGILSHLELERREADDVERREEIDQCIEGTKRISSAVHGLLDYARPNPLTLSKVNLQRLADESLRFVGHQPMFRHIELQNCIPPDLPTITADSNQISQILMNLLLNAAQATPPGGRITILADKVRLNDMIELRVCDTGSGIPADILPHVFEPFFTTKRGKGTGLGLSITQNYVRSHGGDIQVESIAGYGTTVRVTLPVRQSGKLVQSTEEVIA
jgi:signal transduction histidine kinase